MLGVAAAKRSDCAAEVLRETEVGVLRRRAAETDAQCTAASYAPGPWRVSKEPASGTVGSSHVKVILSSESSGRLKARRMASVKSLYPSGPGFTSKL